MRCTKEIGASPLLYIVHFIISFGLVFKEIGSFAKLI